MGSPKSPTNYSWPSLLPSNGKKSSASRFWRATSAFVVPFVAVQSKLWLNWLNRFRVQNHDVLLETLDKHFREKKYPLITISNHHSCLDDPGLLAALFPWRWTFNSDRHRWTAAAYDICFTKRWHTMFFVLGKTYPIVRGIGINQKGIEYTTDLMKQNAFVHVFPQAKVVDDHVEIDQVKIPEGANLSEMIDKVSLRDSDFDKPYELKWGLAKAIMDYLGPSTSKRVVAILPFYHIGMHEALPNAKPGHPYIPRIFKNIYVHVRESGPILIDHQYLTVCWNGDHNLPIAEKRRLIMKRLEEELKLLKLKAIQFRNTFPQHK